MSQCQSCHKKEATVHLTEIVNGEKREVHLCEECAQKEGVNPLSAQSFFTHLMDATKSGPSGQEVELTCTGCGLTYTEFRQRGRLGCSECYKVFREPLARLLEKIHGGRQHLGKIPARAGEGLRRERELIELRRELTEVIHREEYERAAQIRDRLRQMEAEDTSGAE
jgi:protein arginine kinase activator